ncbi:MAG: hypothetical protein HS108_07005 [Planctomycetes bacterium]|jgi:hypothetical protein|nr:hypothetical protein [Planctomycetota bacterium]MCL4729667.1 hypothetical protein [Planctomycetota bacterium]
MGQDPEQDELLFEVSRRLEDAGIPSMLTGGLAFAFYGQPRDTIDIDLVIDAHGSDLDALLKVFPANEGWYLSEDAAREALRSKGMVNAIHSLSGNKIDLIVLKPSEYEQQKFRRRQEKRKGNVKFWITTPEDLVVSKLVWGMQSQSEKQARDIRVLLRALPELDFAYVEKWAHTLGAYDWLASIRAQ